MSTPEPSPSVTRRYRVTSSAKRRSLAARYAALRRHRPGQTFPDLERELAVIGVCDHIRDVVDAFGLTRDDARAIADAVGAAWEGA